MNTRTLVQEAPAPGRDPEVDEAIEIRVAAVPGPSGVGLEDFVSRRVPLRPLADGEVLVRTTHLYVAAAFQDMMSPDCPLPVPPFALDQPMWGAANVGTVIATRADGIAVGELVQSMSGWTTHSQIPASQVHVLPRGAFPDPSYFLGQGPTALHGMKQVARVGPGDVVLVTGAAGGVGSLAGQVAKRLGAARVIGTAGSAEKVDYLVNVLGFDAGINYRNGRVEADLREAAPDGITVMFDTVGGQQLEIGIRAARPQARFALCGALAHQSDPGADHPRLDLMTAITKDLTIRPFATYHTPQQIGDWFENFARWFHAGDFVYPQTVVDAPIEDAPSVLVNLLRGAYRGNVCVRLPD